MKEVGLNNTMMIMVNPEMVCYHFSSTSFYSLLTNVIISTQSKVFNKGHIEVYRASIDELLRFHQLK
jgi:hypothetical protein